MTDEARGPGTHECDACAEYDHAECAECVRQTTRSVLERVEEALSSACARSLSGAINSIVARNAARAAMRNEAQAAVRDTRAGLDVERVREENVALPDSLVNDIDDEPPCSVGWSCCHACEVCWNMGCRYEEWLAIRKNRDNKDDRE